MLGYRYIRDWTAAFVMFFNKYCPWGIFFYALFCVWEYFAVVDVTFEFLMLTIPDLPSRPFVYGSGVLIFALFVALQVAWLSSWFWTSFIWFFRRRPNPRPAPGRVTHASIAEITAAVQLGQPSTEGRYRRCTRMLDGFVLADRVYHCTRNGEHYALYDHFCNWMGGIYLDNLKPFILAQIYMFLNAVYFTCVSIFRLATQGRHAWFNFQGAAVALCLLVVGFTGVNAYQCIQELGWRDRVAAERKYEKFFDVARTISRGRSRDPAVDFFRLATSPWDQGSGWANLREVLGDGVWKWFIPFLSPSRVTNYGKRRGGESDLPLGPFWRQVEAAAERDDRGELPAELTPWLFRWKPRTANRRGQGRSSGVDAPFVGDPG